MSHSHATGSIATPAELSTVTSPSTTSMGIMRMDSEGHPGPGQLHLPPGAVDPTRGMPTDKSPGVVNYFAILQSTRMWSRTKAQLATLSTPAPGAQPVHFDSLYARNTFFQMYCLLGRVYRSYWRNVGYNYVRLTTLAGLMLLFGVIYYKLDGNSLGGVQSLVSVMFMTTAFIGLTGMNTGLPVQIKSRPVFYRERFSYYYGPEVYAFTNILAELPWILLVCLTSIPIIYFMVGFNPDGGAFFFYALVTFIFSVVFTSIAQFSSALMPSIQIAQAVIGLIIPLLFLFGGLFLREPSIPRGWKWMHIIDPITYALEALVAPQFYCAGP
ncbi:ABC transporter permease, partial [archaeon]